MSNIELVTGSQERERGGIGDEEQEHPRIPGNGKLFSDGVQIAKIEWSKKRTRVPVFRGGAGHPEIGFVHPEQFSDTIGRRSLPSRLATPR
jgi:hypothetical protein